MRGDEIADLLSMTIDDGFVAWRLSLPSQHQILLKSILEGYEGMATLYCERPSPGHPAGRTTLAAVAVAGPFERELEHILCEVLGPGRYPNVAGPNVAGPGFAGAGVARQKGRGGVA